jgi:hypothetical protein
MNDKTLIKKNILDAELQKYFQISSTSIIIGFTYLIGIIIALFSNQINLTILSNLLVLITVSTIVLGLVSIFFINSIIKIKRIMKAIKNLENFI